MVNLGNNFGRSYKEFIRWDKNNLNKLNDHVIPTLIPRWDHTIRRGKYGTFLFNSNPDLFKKHCLNTLSWARKNRIPFVMLRSWNEWGEGNFIEPDFIFKKEYLESIKKARNICGF